MSVWYLTYIQIQVSNSPWEARFDNSGQVQTQHSFHPMSEEGKKGDFELTE